MRNFQSIVFIWTQPSKEIFKSALVYLQYWFGVESHLPKKVFSFNESLKNNEKGFLFAYKAFFFLKILNFLSWVFLVIKENDSWEIGLISKFMTSRIGKQIIIIHIFPNIARSKGNQTKNNWSIERI